MQPVISFIRPKENKGVKGNQNKQNFTLLYPNTHKKGSRSVRTDRTFKKDLSTLPELN